MFKNYFKTISRNLFRNKTLSVINTIGLGLGIACSLLIFLWVNDERKVNAFHVNNPYLYSVYEKVFPDNKVDADYNTPSLIADETKKTFLKCNLLEALIGTMNIFLPPKMAANLLLAYVRDKSSPTGWLSLREMTQDAPDTSK